MAKTKTKDLSEHLASFHAVVDEVFSSVAHPEAMTFRDNIKSLVTNDWRKSKSEIESICLVMDDAAREKRFLSKFKSHFKKRIKQIAKAVDSFDDSKGDDFHGQFVVYRIGRRQIYGKVKKVHISLLFDVLRTQKLLTDHQSRQCVLPTYGGNSCESIFPKVRGAWGCGSIKSGSYTVSYLRSFKNPVNKLVILPIVDSDGKLVKSAAHTKPVSKVKIVGADEVLGSLALFIADI